MVQQDIAFQSLLTQEPQAQGIVLSLPSFLLSDGKVQALRFSLGRNLNRFSDFSRSAAELDLVYLFFS